MAWEFLIGDSQLAVHIGVMVRIRCWPLKNAFWLLWALYEVSTGAGKGFFYSAVAYVRVRKCT